MSRTALFQTLRIAVMILAAAGIIYALEYMQGGAAVWFWVTLLGIGFVGLLYSFRVTQRRTASKRRNTPGEKTPKTPGPKALKAPGRAMKIHQK